MEKKTLWITRTALMLSLLIVLQWLTKPLGQLVTGSCVNGVLALTALLAGLGSGVTVAVLSPIFAYLFGIAPNLVMVPAIMAGNAAFVLVLHLVRGDGKSVWKQVAAWFVSAVSKFAVLYFLVTMVICGVASETLLERGVLKAPMLTMLPTMFTWPQLITALIGGAVALLAAPTLQKALHKK